MVMRCFVGAFCGPRTVSLLSTVFGNTCFARRKFFMSAAISSRTFSCASIKGLDFGTAFYLSIIGFAKSDHANAIWRFRETQDL